MEFNEVIKKREATRMFSSKEIEKEKLDKVLEAGRIAPTAKNIQPIKIYVVSSKSGIEKLDKASHGRYGAPTVLVVCGNIDEAFMKGTHSTYEIDASITATHMMLEATNQGLGSIWIEMFDEEALRKELNIPTNLIPVCLIPIGYRDENCPDSPRHNLRKDIDEIIEYI